MKHITITIFTVLFAFGAVTGQVVNQTQNKVDKTLRSNARINPSTLGMEFSIPLADYPGRAGTAKPLSLQYSSKVWGTWKPDVWETGTGTPVADLRPDFAKRSVRGWTTSLGVPWIEFSEDLYDINGRLWGGDPYSNPGHVKRVKVMMPDGSSYDLRQDDGIHSHVVNTPFDFTGTYLAVDSSKTRLEVTSTERIFYLPDGGRIFFDSNNLVTSYKDRHGNKLTYATSTCQWTDTLGRVSTNPLWAGNAELDTFQPTEGTQNYEFPGFNGQNQDIDFVWAKLSSQHSSLSYLTGRYCLGFVDKSLPSGTTILFSVAGIPTNACDPSATPFDPILLTEIRLQTGSAYKFHYNLYGEIDKIEYPTGGYERFEYGQITPIQAANDSGHDQFNRGVKKRWISHDGTSGSEVLWQYDVTRVKQSQPTDYYNIRTTAPDNSYTEAYLYDQDGDSQAPWGFGNIAIGRAYDERAYSTTGQLISRKLTHFSRTGALAGGYWDATRDLRPQKEVSIVFEPGNSNVLATMTETVFDTSGNSDPAYFSSLNAKQQKTYDYVVVNASTAASADVAASVSWFNGQSPTVVNESDYLYSSVYKAWNITGLVSESRVEDAAGYAKAKTQFFYDQMALVDSGETPTNWEDPSNFYRGLLNWTRSYHDIGANLYVETQSQYDRMGNLRFSRDGRENWSQTWYGATPWGPGYDWAYPTLNYTPIPDSSGINGANAELYTSATYDLNTGLPLTIRDVNGQYTTMEYNDPLLRPTKVTAPNGHQTITEYGAGTNSSTRWVKVKSQIDSTYWEESLSWFDGLGRTIRSQSVDAEDGDVFTMTCYDNIGRAAKTTNPFRAYTSQDCSTTTGIEWTTNTYDAAGRPWKVTTPDGAIAETTYGLVTTGSELGEYETVTDESGKIRRTVEDASENLIRVDEPDQYGSLGSSGSPNQKTVYDYDEKDNLLQIVQGGQTRSFSYDALNRLTQASNPESGIFQYTYDANGNLAVKTDARGITTTHTYDRLNRVTVKDYSGTSTPDVTYYYDSTSVSNSKGNLTKVTSTSSENRITSYDLVGNITGSQQVTDGNTYGFTYTYNLDNDLVTQTYPSGKVVQSDYDANGELSKVSRQSSGNSFTYANSFSYSPSGEVEKMRFGNGRWETTQFNSRRQITQKGLGYSATDSGLWKSNYEYGDWNGSTIDAQKNNGNVARQTITVPTIGGVDGLTAIQSYTYDSLDRLKWATETISGSQTWKQTFIYDRFGNRNFDTGNTTLQSVDSTTAKVVNPEIVTTNNRFKLDQDNDSVNDYGYDSSGNLTKNAQGREFTYNAENLQITATGSGLSMTYAYDGNNKRVKSYDSINDRTTLFVYDASGKLAAEYTTNVTPPATPVIGYLTEDALGSPRVISDSFGDVKARRDFLPYGEELYSGVASRNANQKYSSSTDNTRKKFATYQRDGETGIDFAQSRYYSPMHGRFTSPDEFKGGPDQLFDFEEDSSTNPTFYADLANPQSLNKYQYSYNNPYKYNDPSGHCPPCDKPKPAIAWLPVLAGAAWLINTLATPTGPRQPQTNAEKAADLFSILPVPGAKYVGGFVGKIFFGAGGAAAKQLIKQPVKQVVKKTVRAAPSKVNKSVSSRTLNGRFTIKKKVVPSKIKPGLSRAEVVIVRNAEGKVIRVYKDSFDLANKFQGRKPKPLPDTKPKE